MEFILTGNHIYIFHIKNVRLSLQFFFAIDIFVVHFFGVSSQIEIKQWYLFYIY